MNCLDCEEAIPQKRLAAVPGATYCVGCQPRHDQPLVAIHRVPTRQDEIDAADFAIVSQAAACVSDRLEEY